MTICFFSAQYLPTVGGVERYTYSLANYLLGQGHRVLVVTSALESLPATETSAEGIEIYRLPVFALMNGRFPVLKPNGDFHTLAKQLWKTQIDFCVVQTRFYPASVYAAGQCKKRHIPFIVVEHSTSHLQMNSALLNAAGNAYEHMAASYLKHCGAQFYGVSSDVSAWLSHFGIAAKGQLYNAVAPNEIAALANAPDAIDWRKTQNLAPDTKIVSFVGRILKEKGVFELVEAFAAANVPNTALFIAGNGPQFEALQHVCPANVHLLGAVPYSGVMQLLRQSQLYCLPTYYAEGFPTTFLEATACGCPIVTTKTGGSSELLPDESYGIVLDNPPRVSALATALATALNDDAWRQTAAKKAGERLAQYFTWQAVGQALEQIVADACASQRRPEC